jgi:hypothetical protein
VELKNKKLLTSIKSVSVWCSSFYSAPACMFYCMNDLMKIINKMHLFLNLCYAIDRVNMLKNLLIITLSLGGFATLIYYS